MSLEPVLATPGLWRTADWAPGTPGVYALIVGASEYAYLDGGPRQVPDPHQLGQLVSSASTAAALFDWLRQAFKRDDLPVVWCQLLLAPTAAERADLDARGIQHYAEPTNQELRAAIQRWTGNVPDGAAAQKSRTLFFFSGHGVQTTGYEALLLPSDYLDPAFGRPHYENCISANELWRWMAYNPIAEHLALLDACRNEFSPLASKGAAANAVFPINPPGGAIPKTAAMLQATLPNTTAFQLAGRPLTFFGEAVLEALVYKVKPREPQLAFFDLVEHVTPRVNELLKSNGGGEQQQAARPSFEGSHRMVVTQYPQRPTLRIPGLSQPIVFRGDQGFESIRVDQDTRFDPRLEKTTPVPLGAIAGDYSAAHRLFGHEYATEVWAGGVTVMTLDGRRDVNQPMIRAVRRNEESSLVEIDMEPPREETGYLLTFDGQGVQRGPINVLLPADMRQPVIRLLLTYLPQTPADVPRLRKVEARLGPSDDEQYAYFYALTVDAERGSLERAAKGAELSRLVEAVKDKRERPTAAMAGAVVLASAGRLESIGDWTRNLMNWFPEWPDGAVLWAETVRGSVLRNDGSLEVENRELEITSSLETMYQRGLPFFADLVDRALSLARWTTRRTSDTGIHARLAPIEQYLEHALGHMTPGGHFTVLVSPNALGLARPQTLPTGA